MTVTFLQGDCLEVMKTLEDSSVNLILTDPPFGITRNFWDVAIDWQKWWKEANRILKPNATVVIFSSGMHTANVMMSNPSIWKYNLIWKKNIATGHLNAKKQPLRSHEDIVIFQLKKSVYVPVMSTGHFPMAGKTNGKTGTGYNYAAPMASAAFGSTDRYPRSILEFNTVPNVKRRHHSEKPAALLKYLLTMYSMENDLVLDTFSGSGSTGDACKELNRRCILIDKDKP